MSNNSHLEDGVWKLYYDREDDRPFAELLKLTSQLSNYKNVQILRFPRGEYGKLPHNLRKVLFFGRPDVAITYSDNTQGEHAVFACEITKSEAARDHWMQRFTSSVGLCITGIPSAIILPFEIPATELAPWNGKLDYEFFYAFKRVMDFHKTPICLVEWEASNEGILSEDNEIPKTPDRNSQPMINLIKFIDLIIDYTINGKNQEKLFDEKLFKIFYETIESKITQIPLPSGHKRLQILNPTGVVTTSEMLTWLNQQTGINIIEKPYMRKKSLIFTPRSQATANSKETLLDRIKKRNGNPYNGMPLTIDYLFCRTGPSKHDRDANLVLNLTELSYDEFIHYFRKTHDTSPILNSIPTSEEIAELALHLTEGYTFEIKDVIRQFCYVADIIVLKDCILPFYDDFLDNPKFEISEAEIQSITRRFFQKNGFRVISRTPSGKDIHYKTSITSTPKLKAPDLICIKDTTIIIAEQKVESAGLFSGNNSDAEKIKSFLNNNQAVAEFLEMMKEFGDKFDTDSLIGGFSSLSSEDSEYELDKDRVLTGIKIDGKKCTINLLQDGGMPDSFPYKSLDLEI